MQVTAAAWVATIAVIIVLLFVVVAIIASFAVPAEHQQEDAGSPVDRRTGTGP